MTGPFGELGTLDQVGDRWRVTFTRSLPHPPAKVWRAITEPAHIRAWFPTDVVGERTAGAALTYVFREQEGPTLDGAYLVFDPPSALEMTWGDDLLRFELTPADEGTTLVLQVTFDEHGRGVRDASGWHVCLDHLAVELVDDGAPPPVSLWSDIQPRYVERFGPDAATIGPPQGADEPAG